MQRQTAETSVKLLRAVVHHILEREQQKIVPAFLDHLPANDLAIVSSYQDKFYASDEQAQRLLASVLQVNIDCIPKGLPLQLEATYTRAVKLAMGDHPFLQGEHRFANSVFESYLYARALRGDFGDELADRVKNLLLESPDLPSPLLAEFYLDTDVNGSTERQRVIPETLGNIVRLFA